MAQKKYIHIGCCIWHHGYEPATTSFAVPYVSPHSAYITQQ